MKMGGFGRIADYDAIKAAGFDYAELDLPEIEELSDDAFEAFCEKVNREGFPVLTGARALPIADPCFLPICFRWMPGGPIWQKPVSGLPDWAFERSLSVTAKPAGFWMIPASRRRGISSIFCACSPHTAGNTGWR